MGIGVDTVVEVNAVSNDLTEARRRASVCLVSLKFDWRKL